MRTPDKHIKWMEKFPGSFEVVLNIGREKIIFKQGCGVRKDNNLAPNLFIIVMQLFAEDMVDELKKKKKVELPNLKCSTTGKVFLKLHDQDDISKISNKIINMFR